MNKIYKVVWNKARNCYVVVSEFAKNHSTISVTKKKVSIAAILAAGMLSGFSPMVSSAANNTGDSIGIVIDGDGNIVSSSNSVTLGNEIRSLGGANVAIGFGSKAGNQEKPLGPHNANGATAVGTGSQATNYRATALGDLTVASGVDSIGLGTVAKATGNRSISAGLLSQASGVNAIAIGDKTVSSNNDTVAIGEKASATNSQSIAIGSAASSSGSYSVAIGLNAKATDDWSVALGNSSETSKAISTSTMAVGGKTYQLAGGSAWGTVSVGNDNIKRTVTNVAAGRVSMISTDAINGSQLFAINQSVDANTKAIANNATNISSLSHSISNLDNRVNKVGAGAAALAALHPLDFDPDAKWDFAAGYGNYRGTNAAAVGAYYRPNEDTMFSVGGTFGNGENMVNAGVSFKLGSGSSHVSTSRVAMAKEIKELRGELEAMKSAMLDANAGKKIDTSKLQLFPDVPQNHWAYEYVAQLAGNGMIEGYPDGNFAGDRPMTRYEFAAILYRAMTKGAVLSDKLLSEFSHELEYFTVDTIAKDNAGNPTIQRVRTVKENKNK